MYEENVRQSEFDCTHTRGNRQSYDADLQLPLAVRNAAPITDLARFMVLVSPIPTLSWSGSQLLSVPCIRSVLSSEREVRRLFLNERCHSMAHRAFLSEYGICRARDVVGGTVWYE